ncbi:hypothetical protein ACFO5R_02505 [Halosolutus amylolyticus]|uniref:Uncharacterized protein n=1 Tax=Halosolutus amylolyticus TaxID=2932267 RepID=A0ABD5PK55_9EURY|nr:hypothetical protein [Halosolutus amylolyticus]
MSTEDLIRTIQVEENKATTGSENEFYIPEKYQLGILTDHLKTHGFEYTTEGRIFCYPIDILCARGETTVAIEMKADKVSRGIDQAWRNTDFVDFSYLAVWEERVTDSLIERVEETPVGLYAISEDVEQVSTPQKTGEQLCSRSVVFSSIEDNVRNDTSVQQPE